MKKEMIRVVLSIAFIVLSTKAFAQKEANIWYFGENVGIDFNSGSPTLLTNSNMDQYYGSASIADSQGNLLFYTNGKIVWNKNHRVMSNGTGLMGGRLVTQPALIVPAPNNHSLYYVFTLPDYWTNSGLRYSIIDMSRNGGLGQVTQKNIFLFRTPTEKIAAVKHCNNTDVWVVATEDETNNFHAFLIGQNGACTSPIISSAGQTQYDYYGSLKFSPDGSKLVNTMGSFDTEIFNFDRATGQVTFWRSIPLINRNQGGYTSSYFYASFSPDGSKLYCTSGTARALDGRCAKLVQYDLNVVDISSSLTILYDNSLDKNAKPFEVCQSKGVGALQLGPDGKIYITNETGYLHVITDPNKAGIACNFVENAVPLNGKNGQFGLPNFIESYFDANNTSCTSPTLNVTVKADFTNQDSCSNQNITFVNQSSSSGNTKSYFWDFGDIDSPDNLSTQQSPTHNYSKPGIYTVTLVAQASIGCLITVSDTIHKQVSIYPMPSVSFGEDTTLCEGETLILNATNSGATYLWQDNTTRSTYQVTQSGLYWVKATIGNCSMTDTIEVNFNPLPSIDLGKDTTLCEGETITLDATTTNASYQWSDNSTNSTLQVTQTGTYWVEVTTLDGCSITDTIQVTYNPLPSVELPDEIILCEGETRRLDVTLPNATYLWQDNSTNPTYQMTKPGTYWVTIRANNCSITDTIQVINPTPNIYLGNDTTICMGTTMILNAFTPNATYLWQDNSTNPTFDVSLAGSYWVEVTVNGCSTTAMIEIQERDCEIYLEMPNVVTPNQDGKNDVFTPIRSNGIRSMNTRIYNRWGKEVFNTNQLTIDWRGTTQGGNIAPNGVYFWVIKYTDVNGSEVIIKGTVTILK